MAVLFSGTSGYAYSSWKPDFYPPKLASRSFLAHYATRLNSVEINYTFRQLPKAAALQGWVDATAPGFLFALKAHMRLTHILRLKNAAEFTEVFLRAIDPLRATRRLGPVLFQLPPNMKCDTAVLSDYLALLPPDIRFAFEFRHASWHTAEVFALLEKHRVSLCLAESEKLETPQVVTADFVYARLRKPEYSAGELSALEEKAKEMLAGGRDVFVYFKHEDTPDGALNAERLLAAVGGPRANTA
jgi:uncharacterized protein YecE (DUF72 family)